MAKRPRKKRRAKRTTAYDAGAGLAVYARMIIAVVHLVKDLIN